MSDLNKRDKWWEQLRDELRSHAESLCCTCVLGYREEVDIHGDVAVLSVMGTAARIKLPRFHHHTSSHGHSGQRVVRTAHVRNE